MNKKDIQQGYFLLLGHIADEGQRNYLLELQDWFLQKLKEPEQIRTIRPVYDANFHGIECLESDTQYGFEGCYGGNINHPDVRPSGRIWLNKVDAEKLYKLFKTEVDND